MKNRLAVLAGVAVVVGGAFVFALQHPAGTSQFLQWHLDKLNSVSPETWSILIEVALLSVPVTVVSWLVKTYRQVENSGRMSLIVIGISMLAGVFAYLHGNPTFAQWFAPVQGAMIFTMSQPVYRYAFKPGLSALTKWFNEKVAEYAVNSEAQGAAVPAQGLPLTSAGALDDFSH